MGLALAVALPLAACGSSASSDADASGAGGATELTVIRSTGATFEPLYIAQDQGIFAKHGLAVTLLDAAAGGGSTSVPRVLNGEAQVASGDVANLGAAVTQGLPVQAFVTTQLSTAAAPVSDGMLVKAGSSIAGYGDLAGKTVGISALGGFPQAIIAIGAAKAGVDPNSIKFVQLPTASLIDSVQKGDVDAIVSFASFYDAAKSAGLVPVGNGSNDVPGVPQSLFFASTQWLGENGDTAAKFQQAMAEAFDYANAHPDAVRQIDKDRTELSDAYIDSRTIQEFGGEPDQAAVNEVLGTLVTLKVLTTGATYDDLYAKT